MSKKLIILYTANYCNKMRNVYEVDTLVKKYNVEFWNLSKITAHAELAPAHTDGLKEIEIKSLFHFYYHVWKNNKLSPVYASVMGYSHFSYKVFLILSLFKCTFAIVTSGTLPSVPIVKTKEKHKIFRLRKLNLKNLNYLISVLLCKTSLIKAADYALISCNKAKVYFKTSRQTKYINSCSGDYIDSMNVLKSPPEGYHQKYIVFLDQYLPFHYDYDLFGQKKIEAEYYFSTVNTYFKNIENQYSCEVIVAAHPSASKYKDKNYFEGRKVVFNQTASLVVNAIGVLTLNSTAVSYAAVFKKPIIFMSMPGFCDYDYSVMHLLAEELNSKVVDISKNEDYIFDEVPVAAYNQYITNYLSKLTDGTSNADVFSRLLDE